MWLCLCLVFLVLVPAFYVERVLLLRVTLCSLGWLCRLRPTCCCCCHCSCAVGVADVVLCDYLSLVACVCASLGNKGGSDACAFFWSSCYDCPWCFKGQGVLCDDIA